MGRKLKSQRCSCWLVDSTPKESNMSYHSDMWNLLYPSISAKASGSVLKLGKSIWISRHEWNTNNWCSILFWVSHFFFHPHWFSCKQVFQPSIVQECCLCGLANHRSHRSIPSEEDTQTSDTIQVLRPWWRWFSWWLKWSFCWDALLDVVGFYMFLRILRHLHLMGVCDIGMWIFLLGFYNAS